MWPARCMLCVKLLSADQVDLQAAPSLCAPSEHFRGHFFLGGAGCGAFNLAISLMKI